ncbi:8846_t:CDS:2 [Diversispora eburnea]|uniref:8846_t:CDS:1 n=1 Tax=Diversispora eburnea TaxID=1213867 RepID=A0A9N8VY24_9GLOM|nr:8846_t:CDS:2 [Diversispora eburnea]
MASLFRDVKILLKNNSKSNISNIYDKNFIRKFHDIKIQRPILTSFPHSFLKRIPKNAKNSNIINLRIINFKHNLYTSENNIIKVSETIPSKKIKPVKPIIVNDKVEFIYEAEENNEFDEAETNEVEANELAAAANNSVEAKAWQFKKEIRNVFENDREFYIKNYKAKINIELFKAWLRGLGLKPLIPLFKGKSWLEIANMRMKELLKAGIIHLNLRRRVHRHLIRVRNELVKTEGVSFRNEIPVSKKRQDIPALSLPAKYDVSTDGAGLYAPYFKGLSWREILYLNGEKMKQLGITNVNAQQLLLRAFMTERTPHKRNEVAQEIFAKNASYYKENYVKKTNFELLEDFPAWLEGLGLKPLTMRFAGIPWQEIIKLRWSELKEMGIYNSYLRKRLIKHFMRIQRDMAAQNGIELSPEDSVMKEIPKMEDNITAKIDFYVFAPFFEGFKWYEIIELSGEQLGKLGILDYETRRILLRGFKAQIRAFEVQKIDINEVVKKENSDDMNKGFKKKSSVYKNKIRNSKTNGN